MIRNIILVCVLLILLAAVIYVLDLCLTAVLNRLNIAEDIKTAVRALVALVLFVVMLMVVLSALGMLPAGWW